MISKYYKQITALVLIQLILVLPVHIADALSITNIEATDIGPTSATINWETDEASTGKIRYGPTNQLGSTRRHSTFVFDHDLNIQGLTSETTYFYEVESTNINGDTLITNNGGQYYTFTTLDVTPPEQVTGVNLVFVEERELRIAWDAINVSDFSNYLIYRDGVLVGNTTHNFFDDVNRTPGVTYGYKVSGVDTSGNQGLMSNTLAVTTIPLDFDPPTLFNIQLTDITEDSITLKWNTDESANGIVYFGHTGQLIELAKDNAFSLNHSVTLENLIPTLYYDAIVSSCDESDNCANASAVTFEAGIDIFPPPINTSIPRFVNTNRIDIKGTVEREASVEVFVNDFNTPARTLGPDKTKNGVFEFRSVQLQSENIVKIVAIDEEGNTNDVQFRVTVDTEDPVVVMDEIPAIFTDENLTIVGTVNEPVHIRMFLRFGSQVKPPKITDLFARIDDDSVALEWNESKDRDHFSHYIIYRNDVGPIAITDSQSYNEYTDLLVNKDEEYIYQVSQVDKFGKESELSDPISITLTAGPSDIPRPNPIDKKIIVQPTRAIEVNRSFSESLLLNRDDGYYTLIIEVEDRAKNKVLFENLILLDTSPPDIEITNPPVGTLIFENYANEMDIRGITEPGSKVHMFVNRLPVGELNASFSPRVYRETIKDVDDSEFEQDCSGTGLTFRLCTEGSDFSTIADDFGDFEFTDVDLTSLFEAAIDFEETDFIDLFDERGLEEDHDVRIIFIVTDPAGLRNVIEHKVRLGDCWTEDQNWAVIPLVAKQSPGFLSSQRLSENKETIQFYFKYDYHGIGKNARILPGGISVQRICSGLEVLDEDRFDISCQIMPSGGFTVVNEEGDHSFTTIQLHALDGMDTYIGSDWSDFFDAISNELTFPMKVTIRYEYETEDGRKERAEQTTCKEVTYALDNSLIDFKEVLPDWLLYDFVEFLDGSIETINSVNEKLNQVTRFIAIGCTSSFVLHNVFQVIRRFNEFTTEKKEFVLKGFELFAGTIAGDEGDETSIYCKQVMINIMKEYGFGDYTSSLDDAGQIKKSSQASFIKDLQKLKFKYFSDRDLKICYPDIYDDWQQEADFYQYFRYTCDRLFGHKTPSKWTENKNDGELQRKLKAGATCEEDGGALGFALTKRPCDLLKRNKGVDANIEAAINPQTVCLEVPLQGAFTGFYVLDKDPHIAGTNIYRGLRSDGNKEHNIYVRRETENSYFHHNPRTCSQICKTKGAHSNPSPEPPNRFTGDVEKDGALWDCRTVQSCRELNSVLDTGDKKTDQSMQAINKGFTADCYYNADDTYNWADDPALRQPSAITGSEVDRFECCCINADVEESSIFYRFDDQNRYAAPDLTNLKDNPSELKALDCAFTKKNSDECAGFDEYGVLLDAPWGDMEWSYRYWKNGYETVGLTTEHDELTTEDIVVRSNEKHSKYNPNRYIEGRDYPACFGQDNLYFDSLGEKERLLIIDSRQQHTSMLQCANVGGLRNRLQMIANLMGAVSTCLVDIRETGTSDSAACKEIFTRYVCDTMWELINLMVNSCSPFSLANQDANEDELFTVLRGGVGAVYETLNDASTSIAQEYGNVEINDLLGAGGQSVARQVCLAAFGYDWELSIDSVIDAAYAQSFASVVQAIDPKREFLTIEPSRAEANFEYRSAWMINPGCNIESYRVDLACVTRNELNKHSDIRCDGAGILGTGIARSGSPDGANCDCLDADVSKEITKNFFITSGSKKQNELVQEGESRIFSSSYRYDHLKITVTPDFRLNEADRNTCFPPGYEDGVFYFPIRDTTPQNIVGCQADIFSGIFDCSQGVSFFNPQGLASIQKVLVNNKEPISNQVEVELGKPLTFSAVVRKSITNEEDRNVKCLHVKLDRRDGAIPGEWVIPIDIDGTHEYGGITLENNINFGGTSQSQKFKFPPKLCGSASCTPEQREELELEIGKVHHSNRAQHMVRDITFDTFESGLRQIDLGRESSHEITVSHNEGVNGAKIRDIPRGSSGPLLHLGWDGTEHSLILELKKALIDPASDSVTYQIDVPSIGRTQRTWLLTTALYNAGQKDPRTGEIINGNSCASGNFRTEGDPVKFQGVPQEKQINIVVRNEIIDVSKEDDSKKAAISLPSTPKDGPKITLIPFNSNNIIIPPFFGDEEIFSLRIEDGDRISDVQFELVTQGRKIDITRYMTRCTDKVEDGQIISCTITNTDFPKHDDKSVDLQNDDYEFFITATDGLNQVSEKSAPVFYERRVGP